MPSNRFLKLSAWCALLALGFAVYAAGLSGYWVFDDFHNIVQNQDLGQPILDRAHLMVLLTSSDAGLFHRPLSTLSFYLDSYWFGLSPRAFKFTNILIHLAAGLCFAGMGRSLLQLYRLRLAPHWDAKRIDIVVYIATALWLLHPINLTAVLYVVQRETELAALFTALAVWAYLWGRRRELQGKSFGWIMWTLTPGLTVLGLACKENAALVPLLILAAELTVLDLRRADGTRSGQALAFQMLFLALPALVVVIAMLLGAPALVGGYAIRDFNMGERVLTECRVLFSYLHWIVLPDLRQLGLYHDDIATSRGLLQPVTTLPAVAGIALLLGGALFLRRRLPLLCFGVLWFFAGHLMESSVLPLELVFEHRNYVPLYGLLLGVVGSLAGISLPETRRLLMAVAGLICLLFGGLTAMRASEWRSPLAFAVYESGHHPGSARAQYEVGAILTAMVIAGQPQLANAADAAMEKARALDPGSISEDLSLAMMHASLGQTDLVRSFLGDAADRAGTGTPNAETQSSLQTAVTFSSTAKQPLPFQPMDTLFRSVLANPRTGTNPCFKGDILNTHALFLEDNRYVPQAMSEFHAALKLCPSLTFVRINYATRLIIYHDVPDAIDQIRLIEQANSYGQYTLYVDKLKTMVAETQKNR